jgi:hypothetical protein
MGSGLRLSDPAIPWPRRRADDVAPLIADDAMLGGRHLGTSVMTLRSYLLMTVAAMRGRR